jgi:hypothetical protein
MYEVSFPKLSDRYFKQNAWPPVDAISDLVDQDHVFCLLYKVRQQQQAGRLGFSGVAQAAATGVTAAAAGSGTTTAKLPSALQQQNYHQQPRNADHVLDYVLERRLHMLRAQHAALHIC